LSDDEDEGGAAAAGDGDEDGFERIKSRQEKKKDKLLSTDPSEITYDVVAKKLREIVVARGKKGIDRSEQARSSCDRASSLPRLPTLQASDDTRRCSQSRPYVSNPSAQGAARQSEQCASHLRGC